MNGTPSPRRAVLVLLALATLVATAGCVNLPANTSVNVVRNPAKARSGVDVRIWPKAPQHGATPVQIVEGFLQTAASDPSNLPIAQDYLTGEAASSWHPNRVVVFSDVSSPTQVADPTHVSVQVTGTEVATVSDDGRYQQVLNSSKGPAPYTFGLTLDGNHNYRIDQLPGQEFGILLTQETFRANYAANYLYYLDRAKSGAGMIPVPNYQRSQADDATTAQNLINALLKGPPDPLAGIVSLAAPKVELAGTVTISPNNIASVPIKTPNDCTTQGRRTCELLADELLATLSNLASVSSVLLVDAQGESLVPSTSNYHQTAGGTKSAQYYYLDSRTAQVERFDGAGTSSNPSTPEPIGPPTRKYSQLAVGDVAVGNGAPQTYAAVVDDKGSKLYLSAPGSTKDSPPIYTGTHITSLSWDAFGHLWFLDAAGSSVSLFRVDATVQAGPEVEQVPVVGDGEYYAIKRIAVAPDGLRIAVSYTSSLSSPAADSVGIAVVAGAGAGIEANLSYGIEQPVVDGWTVYDVGWHGSQSLAVLGSASPSSPVTLSDLNTDGSPVVGAADPNPVAFNPPTGTSNVEWNGSVLLAATHSGSGATVARQIEQYSFTSNTWTSSVSTGFSPSYVN